MNRPLTALFAALEALLVVGIGVGVVLVPLTALWALHYDLQVDWLVFYRAAADVWLLGHGADVRLDLALVGVQGSGPVVVSIAAMGIGMLTLLLGARAGRRLLETDHPVVALTATLLTTAALATVLALTAGSPIAQPSRWQGVLLPTLVVAGGMALGAAIPGSYRRPAGSAPGAVRRRVDNLLDALPDRALTSLSWALRLGIMLAAGLLAVAAVLVAVLLVTHYSTVITLYETLQGGALGGAALTVAQLTLLPNVVVWAASWLIGPGFAIGAGSSVSPLGTDLGPVPSLPLLGALPVDTSSFAFAGLLAPVVLAFLAGALLRGRIARDLGAGAGVGAVLGVAVGGAVLGGTVLGLLALWSGGVAGAGRLAEVGPSPLLVAALSALEFAVALSIGMLVAGGRRTPEGANQPR